MPWSRSGRLDVEFMGLEPTGDDNIWIATYRSTRRTAEHWVDYEHRAA